MPQPAKIATLPAEVRQELHLRVIHSGFSGYQEHSEWLKSQGHDISHAAVWRYFREVKEESRRQLAALAHATQTATLTAALAKESGEDFNLATEHTIQVAAYAKLQEALDSGEISMEELLEFQHLTHKQRLTRLRAVTERARTAEAERASQSGDAAIAGRAAEAGVEAVRRPGLSPEGAAKIRAKIQGRK